MPTLLNNLVKEGKLPVVETSVTIENESIVKLAIALILVIVISMLVHAIIKTL